MRQNENTVLIGTKNILVPYKPEHVPVYHEWMKDPFLQEMTASEPLTLEQEFDMQRSWHLDTNKCTFIVLARDGLGDGDAFSTVKQRAKMLGDVNLFFNDEEDMSTAEIEIMIAEPEYRRNGHGREALLLMMAYAYHVLHVRRFQAKVSAQNEASISLFKKLGYKQIAYVKVFDEVTLEMAETNESAGEEEGRLKRLLEGVWGSTKQDVYEPIEG
ncbi:uncharacterized protein VTP21DRAFT_4855 [Calcarisporiella thermophila]|uniref:uncharacterized protein n=1 Tax=Calcarisporiella thermophila TaxID=911321 RepID=UPI0037440052